MSKLGTNKVKNKMKIRRKLGKLLRSKKVRNMLSSRRKRDFIFKSLGGALLLGTISLFAYILFALAGDGYKALFYHEVKLDIQDQSCIDNQYCFKDIVVNNIRHIDIDFDYDDLYEIMSLDYDRLLNLGYNKGLDAGYIWVRLSTKVNTYIKDKNNDILKGRHVSIINNLRNKDRIRKVFNENIFTNGDSSIVERIGILGGFLGSIFTIFVASMFAIPVGVFTGVYLEEFSDRKSIIYNILDMGIKNLISIPSILFGMVGAMIFLKVMHLPRASSIVGGLTLGMMMLPIVVISTRDRCADVSSDIKNAALALGASKIQAMLHHTIIIAMPGIIRGILLGISRIIGEVAPMLMLGMVAFIVDVPENLLDRTTVLPVQIYIWVTSVEIGLSDVIALSLSLLILILILLNVAVFFRSSKKK